MLRKVISGGQVGADRGGLRAAKAAGLPTGGWMPRGFLALDGYRPEFATEFGLREHPRTEYRPRTRMNILDAGGTIRFATDWTASGERLTLGLIRRHGKPHLDISPTAGPGPEAVVGWLLEERIEVLNVSGNTELRSPGIERFVLEYLSQAFAAVI